MAASRFAYIQFEGWEWPGPALEILLIGPSGRECPAVALLDSGTEWSMVPARLATDLGVDLADCTPTSTRTGQGARGGAWCGEGIEAIVADKRVSLGPIFTPEIPMVALGEVDLFRNFKVAFDFRAQTFELTPYPEAPAASSALADERDRALRTLELTPFSRRIDTLPQEPGVYAVFPTSGDAVRDLGLADVPGEDRLAERALYVGKAESSIRGRVFGVHFKSGLTGSSSLRRTLAALLRLTARPRATRVAPPTPKQRGRAVSNFELVSEHEEKLTQWMGSNLTVKAVTSQWQPLKDLERAVGAELRPVLDQERAAVWSPNPWRHQVTVARERLRERAAQAFE